MKHRHMHHQNTAWLWWLGLFLLVVGGSITYLLFKQRPDPEVQTFRSISLAITCIGVGLCVICATANWWLKR
jgi:hypothetical protein